MRVHRIIAIIAAVALAAGACGNKQDLHRAQTSVYDTDFAAVYAGTYEAVRSLYPGIHDNAGSGVISTSWHPVRYNDSFEDPKSTEITDRAMGLDTANQQSGLAGPTSLNQKRYFIRFDVRVMGGRPWQVRVTGNAQVVEAGSALPIDLRGASAPHWLKGRTEALQVEIYRALSRFAIERKATVVVEEDPTPAAAPLAFGALPDGATTTLVGLHGALSDRDVAGVRAAMAPDVVWSTGGAPGVDLAMAMWQADPSNFAIMQAVISAGCGIDKAIVSCAGATGAAAGWKLTLELQSGAWRVTQFAKAESN